MKKILTIISLIILTSCGLCHHLPPETNVSVRDSVVINYKDSTILHHKTVNKDYAGLLDTLRIQGEHSSMTAYADTTKFMIKGELVEEPFKERVIWKTKTEYKDSIKIVKEPYPVEKPVKYIPKFFWGTFVFSVLVLLLFGVKIYLKIKTGAIQLPKSR